MRRIKSPTLFRILVPVIFFLISFLLICPYGFAQGNVINKRPPVDSEPAKPAFVSGQVVVKFEKGNHVESIKDSSSFELITWEHLPYGFTRLYIKGNVLEACNELQMNAGVKVAEPNYIRHLHKTPNDPLFFRQDNLKLSNAEKAWNIETGVSTVIVAVIDTGVDKVHPDLSANLIPGANFRDSSGDESDDSGHGTAVCGVVSAVGNNGVGVAGAAWNVKILPLRACGGPNLTCSVVDEAEAIQEAIVQGADIINLSLGGFGASTIEESAVNDAWFAGIVVFAAAGNDGFLGKFGDPETESWINYPAGYANVIGVSSVDYPLNGDVNQIVLSDFSNSGDAVSVTAVGRDVVSTAPSEPVEFLIFSEQADYGRIDGTSFSTPLVAGMAAIIKSHFPSLTNTELRAKIESSVTDIGAPGWDNEFGFGLVDFQKALIGSTYSSNSAFNFGVTTNPILNDEVIVVVKVKVPIVGSPVITYQYEDEGVPMNGTVSIWQTPNNPAIWTGRFNTLFSGNIVFKINGNDSGGNLPELKMDYFKGRSN
ncbi:S8 family serine peptidase [bacterium]|nr:S8 family serine peptidase [bacterium]MBU1025025.1 S8 family serine peptidase [bacterium]